MFDFQLQTKSSDSPSNDTNSIRDVKKEYKKMFTTHELDELINKLESNDDSNE